MNDNARSPSPRGRAARSLALLVLAGAGAIAACAGAGAGQRGAGASIAGGTFTPSAPPAARYGPDPSRTCASGAIADLVREDSAKTAAAARKAAPQTEGRLCAVAEALLGWDDKQPVPEQLASFLAQHFGLIQTVPRVTVATLETDKPEEIAPRVEEVIAQYLQTASQLRYGLATSKVRRGPVDKSVIASGGSAPSATKIAVVMQDATVDVEPLPRKLDPGAQATLSGKVLGDLQNPKVLISDTRGKLQQPPEQKGKELSAPLSCGGRTGRMVVEIRAESQGSQRVAAAFPVLCGVDPPASVQLGSTASADGAQEERSIFEQINAERSAAGIAALTWDDKVAQVARSVSQSDAQTSARGSGSATSEQEVTQRLKQAGINSGLVLQNPGEARTAQGAHDRFSISPVHRANYMNSDATHGAVGVTVFTLQGGPAAVVTELFVRQLAPVDVASVHGKLRDAIDRSRASAGTPPLRDDPTLGKVAEEYAKELAASGGNISNARHSQLVSPLYRSFRTVDLLSGAKGDPLDVANEKTVLTTKEKLVGIGVAQGNHPVLGPNTVYVALVFGTKK